jgi:hypothetical protein
MIDLQTAVEAHREGEMTDLPQIKSDWMIECDRQNYVEAVRLIHEKYTNDIDGKFFQLPLYAMKKYAFLMIARYHGLDIPLDSRINQNGGQNE